MKLVALTSFNYDGVDLSPGQEFEATDQHAMILKHAGKAEDMTRSRTLSTASVKAEWPSSSMPEESTKKRRYARRDMQPEE